ncbi:uncharacterized protein ALTATR162_LOCUS5129 [Alternaria atra]|uniref:Uncharacterized protein n=1 Tax=Alternaria atra TaxID=119953 RepID=A0A8J2I2E2_9PLEO|nr:uncharacterized protein ALTATR162_LOCUS5129 [Alternaria atra]CAG5158534.1 unnamed protein product [Alternaria atra]
MFFQMDEPHDERLPVKLQLSQDKLQQEAIAHSRLPEADKRNPTTAIKQVTADKAAAVDAEEIERITGTTDEDTDARKHVPIQRKARMKTTPARALEKRRREDVQAEAEFQKKLKGNYAVSEAKREVIRGKEEEFVKGDQAARKTAQQIEDALKFHYHSPFGAGEKGMKCTEEEMRKALTAKAARGENPFLSFQGSAGVKQ